jgi:hypothetical protein
VKDLEGGKAYIGGYSEDFVCQLDPHVGPRHFRCVDDRLRLTRHEMYEQGIDFKFKKKFVENGEEDKVRYDEVKTAYGCRGLCDAIRLIPWLDYTAFFPQFATTYCLIFMVKS